jgi:hypothetical protein
MLKMQFHEPSPIDRFFETPAHQRPRLNLGVTSNPDLLPPRLRRANGGVDRWFDLVVGFALDDAKHHKMESNWVNIALDTGHLVAHTYFVSADYKPTYAPNSEVPIIKPEHALFMGAVEAYSATLVVAGGMPDMPRSSMQFTKKRGKYVPYMAQAARRTKRSHMIAVEASAIPDPYIFIPGKRQVVPKEMRASYVLGDLAEHVVVGLDAGAMRAYSMVKL